MAGRRVRMGLVLLVAALLLGGSVAVYVIWGIQPTSGSSTISYLFASGAQSDYAYGGSVSLGFNLSNTRNLLRGGFSTNTSLILYVISSQNYATWKNGPSLYPLLYAYYSTGDVRGANISVSIPEGQWFMVLNFVNDTGRTVNTFNGTSIESDTHLTITKTFTITPESLQASNTVLPYGPTNADIEGHSGSNVTGRLSLNMSQAGNLSFQIDNETLGSPSGNSSHAAETVNWVVPMWVSVGAGNYSFSHTGGYLSLGVKGSETDVGLGQGSFPSVISFRIDLSIRTGAPAGQYLITLSVYASSLDAGGTPGIATFSIDITVA